MRKRKVSISRPSSKGKEEEVEFSNEEEEEFMDVDEPRRLPSVSDAFSRFSVPEVECEWGSDVVMKKVVIQDKPTSSSQQWSCGSCEEIFPKVQLLWAHLDICAVKQTTDNTFRSLPPVPKFVGYKPVESRIAVIGEDEEGCVKDEEWDGWNEYTKGLFTPQGLDRFKADTYVPRQDGGSLMTEEEQMKWAMEASVAGSIIHPNMSESERWALQRSASIDHAGDAQVRVMELDREMDDMQIAMAASVMELPMHEYYMGTEAYELSCVEKQIAPYGVAMTPVVLVLLHQRGYLNCRCPKCPMTKNPGICKHFLPHDFAQLMNMRKVCKQWMVCVDNWMARTEIMKSAANCDRCRKLHFKMPETFPLPYSGQIEWYNLKIKLNNDYVVKTEIFPCHYPPHNQDNKSWDKLYH
jgi:hypothetical protein